MRIQKYKKYSFFIGVTVVAIITITTLYYFMTQATDDKTYNNFTSTSISSNRDSLSVTENSMNNKNEDIVQQEYLKLEYPEGLLYYTRTINNGIYTLSYEPDSSNPALYTNEQHSLYILTSPSDALYCINPITLQVTLLSESKVYKPSLHQTYNFIVYTSDRREQGIYDIWLYDLSSNTEAILLKNAYFINWYEDKLIYKDMEEQRIVSYNLTSKQMIDLLNDVELYYLLSNEWIVYTHQNSENIYFYNLYTKLLQQLEASSDMILQLPSIISTNHQYVFGTGYEHKLQSDSLFYFIFDLATGEFHTFDNINHYTQCEANINDNVSSEAISIQKACAIE